MMDALQSLTIYELVGRIAVVIIGISGIIQFTPIKLNPWSWLGKRIGNSINGDIMTAVKELKTEMDGIKADMNQDRAKLQRAKIIRFGSEIRTRQRHSKDYFDEIMNDITEYEQYCNEHQEFKNNITASTVKLIVQTYEKCLRENDFL